MQLVYWYKNMRVRVPQARDAFIAPHSVTSVQQRILPTGPSTGCRCSGDNAVLSPSGINVDGGEGSLLLIIAAQAAAKVAWIPIVAAGCSVFVAGLGSVAGAEAPVLSVTADQKWVFDKFERFKACFHMLKVIRNAPVKVADVLQHWCSNDMQAASCLLPGSAKSMRSLDYFVLEMEKYTSLISASMLMLREAATDQNAQDGKVVVMLVPLLVNFVQMFAQLKTARGNVAVSAQTQCFCFTWSP